MRRYRLTVDIEINNKFDIEGVKDIPQEVEDRLEDYFYDCCVVEDSKDTYKEPYTIKGRLEEVFKEDKDA